MGAASAGVLRFPVRLFLKDLASQFALHGYTIYRGALDARLQLVGRCIRRVNGKTSEAFRIIHGMAQQTALCMKIETS